MAGETETTCTRTGLSNGEVLPLSEARLRVLLQEVAAGKVTAEQALAALRMLPFEDMGFAKLDHHRALRKGFPEVVYCEGKTPAQVAAITARLAQASPQFLGTRATVEHYEAARAVVSEVALPRGCAGDMAGPPTSASEVCGRADRRRGHQRFASCGRSGADAGADGPRAAAPGGRRRGGPASAHTPFAGSACGLSDHCGGGHGRGAAGGGGRTGQARRSLLCLRALDTERASGAWRLC